MRLVSRSNQWGSTHSYLIGLLGKWNEIRSTDHLAQKYHSLPPAHLLSPCQAPAHFSSPVAIQELLSAHLKSSPSSEHTVPRSGELQFQRSPHVVVCELRAQHPWRAFDLCDTPQVVVCRFMVRRRMMELDEPCGDPLGPPELV